MPAANLVVMVPKLPPPVIPFRKNAVRILAKSIIKPAMTKLKLIRSAATTTFHQSWLMAHDLIRNTVAKDIIKRIKIKNILAKSLVMPQPIVTIGAVVKGKLFGEII